MYYVGVDLAWGERKPTGLAVLDERGRLCHVSTAQSDEEILSALAPFVEGDCVVAFDAPLIVVNATGNRRAEAELNRDFARFEAGAHPSNTGKPEFSDTPRGARLASAMGLDLDPRSGRARRALEVYPHPATVALFRLPRTLKYKNKPGRSLTSQRADLLELTDHLAGLSRATPPARLTRSKAWGALVTQIREASRKSELRVVEDQIDAVVAAYVAAYADQHPDRVTIYGDLATGYIVTPTLPADHTPGPRAPSRPADPESAIRRYAELRPGLVEAGTQFTALVTSILDDAGIDYLTVSGRTKSVESFAAKALRATEAGPVYTDPLTQITDQIGVRVITYVLGDVDATANLLADQLTLLSDRDMGQETASEGRFGYASRHLLVALDRDRAERAEYDAMRGRSAQVQIRTVLQHAWAEFEHDIRYKGTVPDEHVPDLDRRFTLAAGLLELADREFSTIRDRLQEDMTDRSWEEPRDDDPRLSAQELASFLAGQYADAGWSRTDHYAWISGLLLELGITSLEELRGVLARVDERRIASALAYQYPPGAVRRLDDALLSEYRERYVSLTGNAHRVALLRGRLARLPAPSSEPSAAPSESTGPPSPAPD